MNVLILDPKTVCVEKSEIYQAEQLDKLGMEVIQVELRDAYAFGGDFIVARLMFIGRKSKRLLSKSIKMKKCLLLVSFYFKSWNSKINFKFSMLTC